MELGVGSMGRQMGGAKKEDRSHLLGPHSSVSSACVLPTPSAPQGWPWSAHHRRGLRRPLQPHTFPTLLLSRPPTCAWNQGQVHTEDGNVPSSPSSRDDPACC